MLPSSLSLISFLVVSQQQVPIYDPITAILINFDTRYGRYGSMQSHNGYVPPELCEVSKRTLRQKFFTKYFTFLASLSALITAPHIAWTSLIETKPLRGSNRSFSCILLTGDRSRYFHKYYA